MVVYDACGGLEVACATDSSEIVAVTAAMTAGTAYKILFHTDDDIYTMVDPTISVSPVVGDTCATAVDLTGQAFPYQLLGTFDDDSGPGGSCDTMPTNIVWYRFTPATTQTYTITANNPGGFLPYSRLVVREGASCAVFGTEVHCSENMDSTITANVALTGGTEYLIYFFTDGDSYTMVDPEITIAP